MTLAKGKYTLNIRYFGVYDPVFCETFLLLLSIAPVSSVPKKLCDAQLPEVRIAFLH